MESNLTSTTIAEIALEMGDAPFGSNLKSSDYVDDGVLVVQGKNITGRIFTWSNNRYVSLDKYNSIPRSHCFLGDLIFPKVGTIGKVGRLSACEGYDKYILSTNTMRLKVDPEKANPLFVYYYFTWKKTVNLIHAMNSKSVQPVFNFTSLKKFPIHLPHLKNQDFAAKVLDSIDNKIELNQQTNQTLEQMAQTLFKSWFVDFDPVFDNLLAKLDFDLTKLPSDFPEALQKRAQKRLLVLNSEVGAVTKLKAKASLKKSLENDSNTYVSKKSNNDSAVNIHQYFPSEFEHNEQLGWIPKGWEVSALSELINIKHGFAYKGEFFSDEKTEDILLTPGNVRVGGGFKSAKYKYYNGPVVEEYIFKEGDVYLNMTDLSKASDTLGYPAVVPEIDGITFHHNQRLGKILYKEHNSAKKEFLYQVLCSPKSRNNVLASATGTTVKHTSPTKILSLLICHSGGCIENMFENHAKALYEKTAANNLNSIGLTKLRDTLLPKLISGELQIPDVEALNEKTA
jgi:type I restriction enzyme S subunit